LLNSKKWTKYNPLPHPTDIAIGYKGQEDGPGAEDGNEKPTAKHRVEKDASTA